MKVYETSQSRINAWRRCKAQYNYRYIRKLEKRKRPRHFLRGGVIHEMIEFQSNRLDPWEPFRVMKKQYAKLFREEQEEYGDLPEEIRLMMEGYFEYYKKDPLRALKLKSTGVRAEHFLSFMISDDILINYVVDKVAKTKDKLRWLVDTKTHKSIPVGETPYVDLQTMIYTKGLETIGEKVDGVMWDYIRAKSPVVPGLLADGDALSQRKNMDTMWPVYRKEILHHGFKLSDYKGMKEALSSKEEKFYVRLPVKINETLRENLINEAVVTAREMRDSEGAPLLPRTIGRHCEWCEFNGLCRAELTGLDADWIRKKEYRRKTNDKKKQKAGSKKART